jgi:hypothetical protein
MLPSCQVYYSSIKICVCVMLQYATVFTSGFILRFSYVVDGQNLKRCNTVYPEESLEQFSFLFFLFFKNDRSRWQFSLLLSFLQKAGKS